MKSQHIQLHPSIKNAKFVAEWMNEQPVEGELHLQSISLLGTDADLGDAMVPRHSQDALGVPALGLSPIPGGESYHIVPPVPLLDPNDAACKLK